MIKPTWGRHGRLPIRLGVACALLRLAACASAPPPALLPMPDRAAEALPSCRLATAAVLDMRVDASGKPVIRVMADGTVLRLWVDSGAETSVLTQDGADRLGIAADTGSRRIVGFGGQQGYGVVTLPWLVFGGQRLRGLRWPVMTLQGAGIDGLVGADLLAPYQVSFDFPAHLLTLYRAYGCAEAMPPWPATPLPWRTTLALPVVAAVLDGRTMAALIDTGAHWSTVDRASMGLDGADLAEDSHVRSFGAGGMAFSASVHGFGSLSVGELRITMPRLHVTDLNAAMPARLVIGEDLLAGHRVWLDYAGRRAFVDW